MTFYFKTLLLFSVALAAAGLSHTHLTAQTLPVLSPEACGMSSERLKRIEAVVIDGIEARKMPGCVVCVGRSDGIVYLEAFGQRKLPPAAEPMTIDTVFDMASITKPVVTATCIMKLVEAGHLRLGDRVEKFFPDFGVNGKEDITIHDLLIHQSGLIPDNALADYLDGPALAWKRICELDLVDPVGERFSYSDVNFIVLAELVRELSGRDVSEFSTEQIFEPLGMNETGYLPDAGLRARAAVTEQRNGQWMRGEVHDPRAYELGGIAGHAGLFSTATDLSIYARMMLGQGTLTSRVDEETAGTRPANRSVQILSPRVFETMTRAYPVSSGTRGLGWDKQTGFSSNRGDLLSPSAFGHGGFTGTVIWIDPELDLFFIFLSNRVHPDNSGAVNHLAGQLVNIVAGSVLSGIEDSTQLANVLPGIDCLARDDFRILQNKRVGLITNHTGRSSAGTSTIELLHRAEGVELTALFSPEHGIEGKLDLPAISDSEDEKTGLQVYSLYGENRAPTAQQLNEIDVVVFDVQDIGTRFYTYISTMGNAMKAAAENGKEFVVLDRPNPIGGEIVTGPMLDEGTESFVAFHSLPVRHGMTTGEIARMLNAELGLDLKLNVVACEGWRRDMMWDRTGLTWVNPSPNMRSLTQALLYPGIGLLETTNLSVGRGTDTPFEVIGAPWIDARQLAASMNRLELSGVAFVPIEFTPDASRYEGELCHGLNIIITDRESFAPVQTGVELALQLRNLHPEQWSTENLNTLMRNEILAKAIVESRGGKLSGAELDLILTEGLRDFRIRRNRFMIYRN